ncbi:LacI family DNA-binding transcriptional regulator [Vibrio sp. JC009]|uniref:LacI family DNA-binding transcriptional regulator n=1 Tax=Vibrio sp. JC009 TaxID=2912314 RepID=UPI0023B15C12|nr:LacI family DNA-binding transcriptional regulator [Vibrio sp. JC009]WED21261.1 LacI family DNA-binding transcriptional regulator [Vibrio sp. JC009]
MSVTFKEVAELAGVSTQTVSRVTNGSQNVAEDTRKRVMAAIEELGYVPNKGAQMLSRAKAMVIGLITLDIGLHGVSHIASGIRSQAQERGYGISLNVVAVPSYENLVSSIREQISQKTEHIIVDLPATKEDAEKLVEQFPDISFVFIDVPPSTRVNRVSANHYDGAITAANLMLSQNRSKFVLITGPEDSTASQLRLKGWNEALKQNSAKVIKRLEGNWFSSSGYLHTRELVASGVDFDAVLVANDQMALGVLRALDEFGIKVPEQVSVTGFDDTEDSAYFTPPLTTVRQDFVAIGKLAVEFVLDEENKSGHKKELLTTELVERKSTSVKQDTDYDKKEIRRLLNQINQLLP